jgi:DNA-binding NarL/FixJ family response regulator
LSGTSERRHVLIADDHAPTRAGVRTALERSGWEVVAEAVDAREAIELAKETKPDVCLLDITMPGHGIRAAGEISKELPEAAIVMLTASRDDRDLFDALRAGAVGYLLKDMDPDRLGAALDGVIAGEAALPRQLMSRVVEEFRGRDKRRAVLSRPKGPRLTSREFEVLDLLRLGLSTEEVATRLFISPVTVRGYVATALKKLRVTDRQAAFRIMEDGSED